MIFTFTLPYNPPMHCIHITAHTIEVLFIIHICRNQYQIINLSSCIIIFIIMQIHFMIHIVYVRRFVNIFINSLLITIYNENLAFYRFLVFFELLEAQKLSKYKTFWSELA